ncbi:MAG: ATP-dependent DNA helicase RecG [Clostridia bacterium]|nr:ATP-dependent DNA helicase RecG [Clostridia bacterium]
MSEMFGLGAPISVIKGVGEKTVGFLEKLGIKTVLDLITYFPRGYEDRSNIKDIADCKDGEKVGIYARLAVPVTEVRVKGGLKLYKMIFVDDSGSLEATAFNQSYLKSSLKSGETYFLYGRVFKRYGKREMLSPSIEKVLPVNDRTSLLPIYRLTEGLSQKKLRALVKSALSYLEKDYETLPAAIVDDYSLLPFYDAVNKIHFPENQFDINSARERLIFEELFVLRAGILRLKAQLEIINKDKRPLVASCNAERFITSLPYLLTSAQRRVIDECVSDISSGKRMQRIVQGDVGSGKTAVAAAVAYVAASSGGQVAFMAPTEILARQHFKTLDGMLSPFGIKVALLTGSTAKKERDEVLALLADGSVSLCVGTHALITKTVSFKNLSLVIADEQHRFGVMQRAALTEKGEAPHLLVMSATPIPRTVGLMIYGGLDISVIDELPAGRKKITTMLISSDRRRDAYTFAASELSKGHQMYIVCPAIDEEDENELTTVTSLFDELKSGYLKDFRLRLLHGKMKASEKDSVMKSFYAGEVDAIVSTTVIEVGIDSPRATLIYIENADRFGLSQLHQLRGRVGRGDLKSYCVLITDSKNEKTLSRLETVRDNNDGFKLMEYDFKERGPGDFFGSRQHGLPQLKIADLLIDVSLLEKAEEASKRLFDNYYSLNNKEKEYLKSSVSKLFAGGSADIFN